ncbi:MAG: hypothetical protein F2672_04495 [Actinobacteria bacterium]|uniref:Unannotated protein n=1 Tax=freshwater metagenome TaxID=449393 RepID=A0A6J6Q3U2_9ZZZZ|nr:hypothetical protein [Actinomycetota bacterium]
MKIKELWRQILHILKPSRTIPLTSWTAKNRWAVTPKNFAILICGLAIFGIGESLLIQSTIGNSPWSVFAQGLSLHTPFTIGECTALISVAVLALWLPLKERPGFGTISNIIVIALFVQIGVDSIPSIKANLLLQIVYVLVGIGLVGAGSAIYITCGLGPGPRDGLMTSIHKRTGIRISRARLSIELTVLVIGKILGGTLGIGTAMFALFIGASIATNLNFVSKYANRSR